MGIDHRLSIIVHAGAGWVMWVLIGLSIVAVAIILDRAISLMASRDDVRAMKEDLLAYLSNGDPAGAIERFETSSSIEARVLIAGLGCAEKGAAAAEERMASTSQLAKLSMERNLSFLATVGSNAPFVGLLGTVIGIIRAFQALDAAHGQVSPRLMAEVGEALVATALGLLVALPTIAFYNLFQRIIGSRLARADALGREVLAYMKTER
ncbi:MotA/TolQ/ExbB proton channel family protein [Pendulispora rubella]|uniref:MotA/TolQ/ExbB proton channel family protein n=1 Tax=Pendulispora rubella TaxID=2741070 RepID=A0ABZ2KYW7_9BACT